MKTVFSLTEARKNLPTLGRCAESRGIVSLTRRGRVAYHMIGNARYAAMLAALGKLSAARSLAKI